jgi:hypothetical protein
MENENDFIHSGEKIKSNNTMETEPNFNITVTPLFPLENLMNHEDKNNSKEPDLSNHKLLKSLNNLYPSGSEWREIACTITKVSIYNDIYNIKNNS